MIEKDLLDEIKSFISEQIYTQNKLNACSGDKIGILKNAATLKLIIRKITIYAKNLFGEW